MIFRFSLYGFLKNQRYFEPFLVLVFLEKGLSFFQIGLLIGFREICINLMEIPSGAAADLYGRRRSMIMSFLSYIVSFVVFAISDSFWMLMLAMFFYGIGDAFRTGTHKAMIFDWLKRQGRIKEKTKVYGFTRSWSKMGSALSVLIAAGLVFYSGKYAHIFWFSIPPYIFAIINFLGYPKYLDGEMTTDFSLKSVTKHLWDALKLSWHKSDLRRLMVESMGFEGFYAAGKDYLQPVIKQTALALPVFLWLENEQRSAILVGIVYFVLHILSSAASRNAHRIADFRKGEEPASRLLWQVYLGLFIIMLGAFWLDWLGFAIVCFVVMAITQNFWRPVLISRFDEHSPPEMGATVLSIESQSKSFSTMILAPLLGLLVDHFGFTPLAVVGIIISGLALVTYYRRG